MDSRLRRMAILSCMVVIGLVSALVLYLNKPQEGTGQGISQQGQEAEPGGEANPQGEGRPKGQIGNDLSAFLRDDSFFDQEVNPVLEAARDNASRLSLVVTSVEKDLRIQVVDAQGELVTGQSFFVELEGLGEYKDLDKDGVIYIGGLAAGEYYVELLPIEGYRVPVNETRVRVKDKVEYVAIDDISLLIMTEDDIDAEAEDTGEADALADADRTEIQKLQKSTANSRVGIDVSKWNGEIDWDKVRNSGVEFAIVRAGYRGSVTGALVEDPYFAANMKGAAASKMPVGVYFFTQAVNEVEAVEEASMAVGLIKGYNISYPVFLDVESSNGGRGDGINAATRTAVCKAFCQTVQNSGYKAGIYANKTWFNTHIETPSLTGYKIWLAQYAAAPSYNRTKYDMWQYSSKGRISGISTDVDMNISYMGY